MYGKLRSSGVAVPGTRRTKGISSWRTTASSGSRSACSRSRSTPVSPARIAPPARCEHGTDTGPKGEWRNDVWYQGSGAIGEKAVERIQIYPPTHGQLTQGAAWEPVRIGILVDMELGQLLADWIDPTILAIEDAMNEGVYQRGPIELVTVDARGLPRENYLKARKGYLKLVEEGCVVVLGPMISDNSVNIRDLVNETGVACIGWTGSVRFDGEYCFTVANGDIPTESVMGAQWCKQNGYEKVGFFWELGSSGTDYRDWFLSEARNLGLEIVDTVPLSPNPVGMQESLAKMRDRGAEAIVYMGYGYSTFHFKRGLRRARLGPATFHGHRVHVLFEHQRVGRGSRRLARRRPARRRRHEPELQRDDGALRSSASVTSRATSSTRWRTTPRVQRSTASRTRRSRSRRK